MKGKYWWSFVSLGCSLVLLSAAQAFKLKAPLGLQKEAMYIPEDNPLTFEKTSEDVSTHAEKKNLAPFDDGNHPPRPIALLQDRQG